MKKLIFLLSIIFCSSYFSYPQVAIGLSPNKQTASRVNVDVISDAFENRRNNLQIEGEGTVLRVLPDDNQGNRHQRFIILLKTGQSLLIAHNIDLAPRIEDLKKGTLFSSPANMNGTIRVAWFTGHTMIPPDIILMAG